MSVKSAKLRVSLPLLALAAIFVSSCASPDKTLEESEYPAMLVSFRDFRDNTQGAIFELVNETYVETHAMRPNADSRVQQGMILDALIDYYDDEGLWDFARPGQGPMELQREAGEYLHSVLEVKRGEQHGWVTFRKGLSKEELTFFGENYKLFLALFNETDGYRAIQNVSGTDIFRSN